MYSVSNAFLEAIRQPVIDYMIDGTIGSYEFDHSNIITGSFHIQNQCTDTSDVVLGSVYTGTLTATFRDINIPRYSWVGKVITPIFYLHVGNSWESVPLGVFKIKEAKHSAEGVEVTAYDNMIKLDKKFKASKFKTAQKMYQHLTTICTACGLTLGMTEEEIQALPNGNTKLGIVGTKSNKYLNYKKYGNDIDTYRDLVFWIAQSMGTFATINRDGELVLRKYKKPSTAVDEITESYRLEGAVFDDFTTNYTGIYVTNTKDGEEIYYGYDVAELNQEISDTESALSSLEQQIMELWTQYQQGEITEEQYKAAVKPLNKQVKNLEKRLDWLNVALEKAQNEEDGLFMDLGENPILQPDGVGSTYDAMRKRVLKALDAISYTPFTCSTVVGVHYDLGDVIQFTGCHATEVGEACCMMAYDFNLNGEFQMQGFGSDPSKPVIKNKNSKKADKADKNGVSAPNVSTGANLPETGNNGDLFIKTGETAYDALDDTNIGKSASASHPISIENFDNDNNVFSFDIKGFPDAYGYGERIWFNLEDLTVGKTYAIEFDAQYTTSAGFLPNWSDRLTICGTTIPFNKDTDPHHYSGTFTMRSGGIADFNYQSSYDDATFIQEFTNFRIKEQTNNDSISVYDDGWKNIDFVRRISGTSSSGKKIGTAENSDDTTTDIYVPNMTGAGASTAGSNGLVPAPASGDNDKFLRGDGTWQSAGGGNDVGLSVVNGAIDSTYDDNGTDVTADILKDSTGDEIVDVLNSIAGQIGLLNQPEVYAPIVYSTEEREVGVWTDGKPLYQKTFVGTIGSRTYFIPNTTNIETLVAVSGYSTSEGWDYNLPYDDGTDRISIARDTDGVRLYTSQYFVNKPFVVNLQYTKTTDTAGSGSYAALGVPSHHYSTNEHVVGTWIDGSTLYEKSFIGTSAANFSTAAILADTGENTVIRKFDGLIDGRRALNSYSGADDTYTWITSDLHRVANYAKGASASKQAIVTVEYTKTS